MTKAQKIVVEVTVDDFDNGEIYVHRSCAFRGPITGLQARTIARGVMFEHDWTPDSVRFTWEVRAL